MQIKNIEIKNFKCLGPEPIKLGLCENILVLIGENNVGKSAVLRALDIFFSNTKKLPKEYFFNYRSSHADSVVITITFSDLSSADKTHQAVNGFTDEIGGVKYWTLRKKYYYDDEDKYGCDYFAIVNGVEKPNPGGRETNVDDLFFEEKMQKIFVEAVKEVIVTTKSDARSTSAFKKIFDLLIKEALMAKDEYSSLLDAINTYNNLFTGSTQIPEITDLEKNLSLRLSRIITSNTKIIPKPPSEQSLLPTPELVTNDNRDIDVSPEEQGHGLQRTIIFTLLELLAEATSPVDKQIGPKNLLLIEEPEIYMHPQMERKIADTLYEIAASGKAQVVCTTHSPTFIRIAEKHRALARLIRKADNSLMVVQKEEIFSGNDIEAKRKKLQMITNFDSTVNEIFFAKRVVLIEGDTEEAVFRESAELFNYFESEENRHKKRDTTFVNCRGKWTIALFQEVLNHFEIEYVIIHDKDDEELNEGANGKILELLGGNESRRKLFVPKIEEVLEITDNGKDKPIKALESVHVLYNSNTLESKFGEFIKFAYNIS